MVADQHRLRRKLRDLKRAGKAEGKPLAGWLGELERSESTRADRSKRLPSVTYDETLPVCQRRDEIAATIRQHQVVIVCGETGSGKSTQLPKICLDLRRGVGGMIGHTQPRRIAARSVAARIADELHVTLGHEVGFKVRFTDVTRPETYVKLMTDGILLAELQHDRYFNRYDTLILDEAHERSLNIDFLIGCLKQLLPKRPELKVIITSATIDAARFAEHFATPRETPPVIEVTGRTYPVEVRYRPIEADEDTRETDWTAGLLDAVDELARIDQGDMLVFMPTERDIHETAKSLREHRIPGDPDRRTQILPLYGRLSTKEQQRVFQPYKHRRIVIATNVAESSLTVPGIHYVIDLGTARISRYSARSKTQRLPIESISRASADQRKGRCGRIAPGICVRLYTEADYISREPYTPPEIQRTNLASVILQMKALRLGNVEVFPFLDPPRRDAIRDGYKTLFEIGALDSGRKLTRLGRQLSRLPVDPRIGRMVLASDEERCLNEVLIIASALEVQDTRLRPSDHQKEADTAHEQFRHEESDFLTILKLWDFYHALKDKLSRNQLRKACQQNFLSYNRMREWVDVHRQLVQLVDETGLKRLERKNDEASIHRAILAGMLTRIAWRKEEYEYTTAGSGKAHLWPGSAAFKKRPRWIVAAEIIETNRRYLRTCGRISPEWVERLAEHLVSRSHSEPHWDSQSASAMAYEKVSLVGLPVVPRRRVLLGPVDPVTARELLIQHGLVEGQWDRMPQFLTHNRRILAEIAQTEDKLRRRDLTPDEGVLHEFYDARIPADIYDGPRLIKWLERQEQDDPTILRMTPEDLNRVPEATAEGSQYPDAAEVASLRIPLEYQYQPGSEEDGVTATVSLQALTQLDPQRLGWLVPGMLEQKIVALIRALPKPIRRRLVPAPDTAKRVLPEVRFGQGDLVAELACIFSRLLGESISPAAFGVEKLPESLKMNVRVVDGQGQTLGMGRDVGLLRRELGDQAAAEIANVADSRFSRDGITAWDFDELPESVEVNSGGMRLQAYPALIDKGESVSLALTEDRRRSQRETCRGLRRLFALAAKRDLKSQLTRLPKLQSMRLWSASIRGFDLDRQLGDLIIDRTFPADQPIPRTQGEFQQQFQAGRARIGRAVQETAVVAPEVFAAYHRARVCIDKWDGSRFQYAVNDARAQLDDLAGPSFLTETPWLWLKHFPRYLSAIEYRFEKLQDGGQVRDQASFLEIQKWYRPYRDAMGRRTASEPLSAEMIRFRWMLEEYRVSLFAQPLGTVVRVSAKRLERQWQSIPKLPSNVG